MAKLNLNAAPTFTAEVGIPVAGGDPVPVMMTFKHRTADDLEKWVTARAAKSSDVESFMDMVSGWDLDEPFTKANVKKLLQNYMGSSLAAYKKYLDELVQARLGN